MKGRLLLAIMYSCSVFANPGVFTLISSDGKEFLLSEDEVKHTPFITGRVELESLQGRKLQRLELEDVNSTVLNVLITLMKQQHSEYTKSVAQTVPLAFGHKEQIVTALAGKSGLLLDTYTYQDTFSVMRVAALFGLNEYVLPALARWAVMRGIKDALPLPAPAEWRLQYASIIQELANQYALVRWRYYKETNITVPLQWGLGIEPAFSVQQLIDYGAVQRNAKLDLSNRFITSLTGLERVRDIETIEHVDLSHNRLARLPNLHMPRLKTLDLSDNRLTLVNGLVMPQLETLNVSNNKISSFAGTAEQLRSLEVLDVSNNVLTAVPNLKTSKLKKYVLHHNVITTVRNEDVAHLVMLEDLNLAHNALTTIDTLEPLKETLKILDCSHNELQDVENIKLDRLESLNLNNNNIKEIAFTYSHSHLHTLSITNNNIERIKTLPTPQLRKLDLAHNNIADLKFPELTLLEELHLGFNQIVQIPVLRLPRLHTLTINDNRLVTVKPESFTALPHLQFLDMASNALQSVQIPSLQYLKKVALTNNPELKATAIKIDNPNTAVVL